MVHACALHVSVQLMTWRMGFLEATEQQPVTCGSCWGSIGKSYIQKIADS
jgi:hypothetical protein